MIAARIKEGQQSGEISPDSTDHPHGSWIELKMINGCGPYVYLRWRENGHRRSKYLGKVKLNERTQTQTNIAKTIGGEPGQATASQW
jgi:hypothetical protein